MKKRSRSLSAMFRECLKRIFARPRKRAHDSCRYRPVLEILEARITPATLRENAASHVLTITLDGVNESVTLAATASTYTASFTNGLAANGGIAASRVTGFGTATVTITSSGVAFYNDIDVVDLSSGDSVSFTNSGANTYDAFFNVELSNPLAGGISFSGTSNFSEGLLAQTTIGNITSAAGSAINVTGSQLELTTNAGINLLGSVDVSTGTGTLSAGLGISTGNLTIGSTATLTAGNGNIATGAFSAGGSAVLSATGNITIGGAVDDGSSTELEAGGAITATSAGNNFGPYLYVVGPDFSGSAGSADLESAGAVYLLEANVTGNLTVTAGGAITQADGFEVGGNASFTTTTGAIDLDSYNDFGGDVSAHLSAAGSDNITLGNYDNDAGGFEIGTISMGSGVLQLDNYSDGSYGNPSVTEDPLGGGITDATGGTVIVNVTNADSVANVLLTSPDNNISPGAGAVTVNGSSFFGFGDLGYRNINATASANDLTLNNFTVNNLTLEFDGNTTALDVSNLPNGYVGGLTILNKGNIDQPTGSISVSGNASFTSTVGDVVLSNAANTFSGDISASVTGAHNITLDNSATPTMLGTISLGSGTLTVNDEDSTGSSSITEDPDAGGITMTGAGSAVFNIFNDATASVLLNGAANNIAGTVTVNGVLTTGTTGDFAFRNTNSGASLGNVTVGTIANPFTIDNLTVEFDNAAINVHNLPAFSTSGNLSVTAGATGISQSAGVLTTSGTASFMVVGSGNPTISLGGSNALSGVVSLNTPATDNGAVAFTNAIGIELGSSSVGTGTLGVTATTGNITENSGATITQGLAAHTATFTANAGTVIDLSSGTDNFFTGQVVYAGANVSTAGLEDSNPLATQSSLTLPAGITGGTVTLDFDNPLASIVLPTQSIAYSLNLTEGDNIVSLTGATFTVTGGGNNLSLTSQDGNIDLLGALSVAGKTTFEVDDFGSSTPSITATNTLNNFGASLGLNPVNGAAAIIDVESAAGLTLAASSTGGGSLTATALNGAITQTGTLSLDGSASFTATGGNITLTNTSNVFEADLSASVSGGDNITLDNSGQATTLGTISLGSGSTLGTLTVNDEHLGGSSSITEDATAGGISIVPTSTTPTTATFNVVNDADVSIDLSGAANDFGPHVTVAVNGIAGGTTGGLGFRNTNPAAAMSQVVLSHFSIANFLTVEFDNTSLDAHTLPAFNSNSALTLTAGGAITQSAGTITAASGSFNVLGDFGITLTNANAITPGSVSFSDPSGDNDANVAFTNAGNVELGTSDLGLGKFTVTSSTGNIVEESGDTITQALGGGAVVFQAAGTTIDLSQGSGNDFSGPVTFTGTGAKNLTTIGFENADKLATLPTLTPTGVAASLTSVTYDLDDAPIALPTINTATLNVTAGGNISQQAGTALTVTGDAVFTATGAGSLGAASFSILLTNTTNSISDVSLNNSGESAVAITTTGGLIIDSSTLGSGLLTVVASGPITETNGSGIEQVLGANDQVAGDVSFSTGNFPILLDNASNQILGPIYVKTTGSSGNVDINNDDSVALGNDMVGGSFSVTDLVAEFDSITQAPGTTFNVTGNAYFSAGGDGITLTNPGNILGAGATVSLNTTGGGANAALTVAGAVELAASNVDGQLTLTAGGAITQLSGLTSSTNDGVVTTTGGASFTTTGAGAVITLTNAGNDFDGETVSLSAPGNVSLIDNDPNALTLGQINFGGTLSIIASAAVSDTVGAIDGSGAVVIANSSSNPDNAIVVTLTSNNNITGAGTFALSNVADVDINNQGNIELTPASTISTSGTVFLTAGGLVTLPNGTAGTLTLGSLTVSANQTNVTTNLMATGEEEGISFTGAVNFTGILTLDTSAGGGNISFDGNVNTAQSLTFNLDGGSLSLNSGTWNQGAHNLAINGPDVQFDIGSESPATFLLSTGTVTMNGINPMTGAPSGGNSVNIGASGTFEVTGAATLTDGGSGSILTVNFASGSTYLVELGASPGSLTLSGANPADQINVQSATLSGTGGTAPSSSTAILTVNGGGGIVGSFSNPHDPTGDFLMGTDIVKAASAYSTLKIQQGGTVATTVTGNVADGDGYTVEVTGGSGLVVIADSTGGLDIVVRTATVATTLTIATTPNGGDGFPRVDGIAIDGAGAVTINAGTTNVNGNIVVAGPLTALTLNDWRSGTLTAGGSHTTLTSITGNLFDNDAIVLGSTLNKLIVTEFTSAGENPVTPSITAAGFGTLTVTGNTLEDSAGDFSANLVDAPGTTTALTTASVKGTLSGNWDLAGTVGTVTAGSTADWNLGLLNGPGVVNAGALTNITSLNLGQATAVTIDSTGHVATLTAISLNDYNSNTDAISGVLQAASFGTISTTGSTALDDHGNLVANITATGNAGGTLFQALSTLSVAGDLGIADVSTPDTLKFLNGNVGTISVSRQVDNDFIDALSTTNGGAITTITAGQWPDSNLTAKSVGTWRITGNLPAQMLGDFTNSTVTLTGVSGSTAATLGTFSTAHDVSDSSFTIVSGSVTGFFVGSTSATVAAIGELQGTDITLESTTAGHLGAITAAQWENSDVTAETIGTVKVWALPAAYASTAALNGDMVGSNILAFETVGLTTPGIGTFSVAGQLAALSGGDYVVANNGITSFAVGRNVGATETSFQVSTDLNGGTGGIGTLTAGSWSYADLAAYSLGTVTITGYTTPEQFTGFVSGDFTNSKVVINGNNAAAPKQGIASMTVKGQLTTDVFNVPAGIGTLTVAGAVTHDFIDLANALSAASGALTTFTAGNIDELSLDANTAGTIQTTGSLTLGLNGNITSTSIAISGYTGLASAPVGIGTLLVAGDFDHDTLQVKDGIGTKFSVAQKVSNATIAVAYDGTNTNANVKLLSAGEWSSTSLVADSVTTFSITGNTYFTLAGDLSSSTINLLGALGGVALGTFTATGSVSSSTFQVSGGNVTSFTTAFFKHSNLFVGYRIIDPNDPVNDTANDQAAANWEGNFTLSAFKTTAAINPQDLRDTAAFQTSNVVAAKLGTTTLSGLLGTVATASPVLSLVLGYRSSVPAAAGTLTVSGMPKSVGYTTGVFKYVGLLG